MDTNVLFSNIPYNIFTRNQILETAQKLDSSFRETQLKYYISSMLANNLIVRTGYGIYSKAEKPKGNFSYNCSDDLNKIKRLIRKEYPLIKFCVWDLTILNEFINHLISHNHIIVEVDKDGTGFVFELLNEKLKNKVLINPTDKELERYSTDNDVFIINAISEAPIGPDGDITIEKLIVDLFANKTLSKLISKGDYPFALEEMFNKYDINETKLFRYASRRGIKEELINFISEETNIKLYCIGKNK
ncbi:MAG: hypothetical protein HUJ61_08125 [Bacilli bacterium]|nr:hypothetical protein [Bacilli bacterium]